MAKNKKTTIGEMCQSRMTWGFNPVSRVKQGKKRYPKRSETRRALKSGKWDD